MFKQNLLKAKIVERGTTIQKVADAIGVSEPTFYRKLARNGDFSREEINKAVIFLDLSREERDNIFFA